MYPFAMLKRFSFILSLMIAVQSGAAAQARAASYGDPNLKLDITLLDLPYNTDHNYAFPSMDQSLGVTKGLYSSVHYAIQSAYGDKYPFLSSLGILLADIGLEVLPFGDAWLHEEFHRAVLKNHGIRSHNDVYKMNLGSDYIAVSHVKDADLETLKREHPAEMVRAHAAGLEGENLLVLNLQRDNFFYDTELWNAPLYWIVHLNSLAYIRMSGRPRADTETDIMNRRETSVSRRDFTGLDFTAWVYDLHRPNEPYNMRGVHPSGVGVDRYIRFSDLTEQEKHYLKRQGRLAYFNFLDPALLGLNAFVIWRPDGEDPVKFNANMKHFLTSFGYSLDNNFFFKQADTNIFMTIHSYFNERRYFPGMDFTYFRDSVEEEDGWEPTTRLALWLQPRGQRFDSDGARPGGLLAVRYTYDSASRIRPFFEIEGKTRGWVAGNAFLDPALSFRVGCGFGWE